MLGTVPGDGAQHRIKAGKTEKLSFFGISVNQLWKTLAVLAMNLVAWMPLVIIPAGHEVEV